MASHQHRIVVHEHADGQPIDRAVKCAVWTAAEMETWQLSLHGTFYCVIGDRHTHNTVWILEDPQRSEKKVEF